MTTGEGTKRRYKAFISYSHRDKSWGRWIHAALEGYRAPRKLGVAGERIQPVFRDDAEVAASPNVGKTIADALERADALIVVCSPNSAKSLWVDKEIADFRALGRADKIFGLIIDGTPHDPANECFPPSFAGAGPAKDENRFAGPLAIDVRTHGRRDTLLKVAAALLGVEYDRLKRRDRQRTIRRAAGAVATVMALLTAYGVSLLLQTRTVNLQTSAVLAALARQSSDAADHGRALRYAVLGARGNLLSPVAANADPTLARVAYFSTLPAELTGHTGSIYSVAFDASGTRLVSGAQDGFVRFWIKGADGSWAADARELDTTSQIWDARLAEHDAAVAVRSLDGDIVIWRSIAGSWTAFHPFRDPGKWIRSFDISPDGTVAVMGDDTPTTQVWRFAGDAWTLEATVDGRGRLPTAVAITGDAQRIAIGSFDGSVQILEAGAAGQWSEASDLPAVLSTEARRMEFSDSGDRLLALSLGMLKVLTRVDPTTWRPSNPIVSDVNITAAAFASADGRLLVTNATSGSATMWIDQAGSWAFVAGFGGAPAISRSVAAVAGGPFATGGNNEHTIRVWEPARLGSWASYAKVTRGFGLVVNVEDFVAGHTGFAASTVVSENGRRRLENDVYGVVRMFDVATGIEVAAIDAGNEPQYSVTFADNDTVLRVSYASGGARDIPVRNEAALSGRVLIDAVCSSQMHGAISILTAADVVAAPVLADRAGQDVCAPRSAWDTLLDPL